VDALAGFGIGLRRRRGLNARASDIDYFYASRLPGEPMEGVEDIHTHPTLPRTARVGLLVEF
jgi:hypothetical protein